MIGVSNKYGKSVIWDTANDHVIEERVENEELGLQSFKVNLFGEEREGCVGYNVK